MNNSNKRLRAFIFISCVTLISIAFQAIEPDSTIVLSIVTLGMTAGISIIYNSSLPQNIIGGTFSSITSYTGRQLLAFYFPIINSNGLNAISCFVYGMTYLLIVELTSTD